LRVFVKLPAAGKAAFCELLLGRLAIEAGDFERARDTCRSALRRLELSESPWLGFHLRFVLGRADEELGDRAAALRQYQAAAESVERLRSGLACDELKIAFFQDKAAVYESLVALSLESREPACESAFTYMEQAKSRGLADLVAFHAQAVAGTGPAAVRLRELRQDLNARYHRLDLAECTISTSAETRRLIRQQARECENEIGRALADVHASDQESASLHGSAAVDLPSIRAAIPCDAAVLEYFLARDTVYACVLDRQRLRIRRAAGVPRVRGLLRLLQFQMGKLRLGGPDTRSEAATRAHLRELYDELVAPVRDLLQASHLVVVPHGFLHYLPFHALDDGRLHLLDAYTFSYAPSAGVYARCMLKTPAFENRSLVLALSDTRTPFVHEEARAAAAALPNARLFLDEAATEQRLREHGRSRFVHIATHGVFRRDNPMFSSVRLGNSHLNLVDFYDLPLSSELVTLSGCSTGLSAVLGGDELVGMVRGLLYAGAHGVMVTLWDVHDRTTAHFMASFYKSLGAGQGKAAALRAAMQDLRGRHPHPYYWAPFVLVGKHL
jgi:CHAT domain-containing protein